MEIKLNWLKMQNFKGVKSFTLNINGNNATIYGDNGTGKTTQMDAFLWLLFNKDSTDRTGFKVKPQDAEGNDIHNLQTEVEAELTVDGIPLLLRKMQEEKWTKRRGSAETELTGNTISYWIDDVPAKEGEYKAKIGSLVDENIFRMITNPMYFNSSLKWQDRRQIILEMCGDVSDEEVIDNDKALARLKGLLNSHSVDDYEKIVKEKIKRFKKERADIPPRIDELTLTLPQQEFDYTDTERQLEAENIALVEIENQITNATRRTNVYMMKQQDLFLLKGQMQEAKDRFDTEANSEKNRMIKEKSNMESSMFALNSKLAQMNFNIEDHKRQLEANAAERNRLISEWKELNEVKLAYLSENFVVPEQDFVCPTCGQDLPLEDKEGKLRELKERFEANKKRNVTNIEARLNTNTAKGLALKGNTEATQSGIDNMESKVRELGIEIEALERALSVISSKLSMPTELPNYLDDPEISKLAEKIAALQSELEKPVEDITSQLIMQKNSIQEKINEYNSILHGREKVKAAKSRIDELMEEEKRISALITDFEGQEFLLEQFVVSKVNYLEDKINSHFKHVKFKMFEKQINGGIAETCIAMVNTNGVYVPFADANHAGKVNAGLDCINALGAFYEVTAPIFIDFRESVSRIIDTNSQVINLYKSEVDKVLRVEVENENCKGISKGYKGNPKR